MLTNLPPLTTGDVFCSRGNMGVVSAGIRFAEKIHSHDNEATYGHSGVIIDHSGRTLESLWTVRNGHLSAYKGMKLIIARPRSTRGSVLIAPATKKLNLVALDTMHRGQAYPGHRLLYHLLGPAFAKIGGGRRVVCSELVARYLSLIDCRHDQYLGTNPDTLADEWRRWRNFDVIWEDIL